MRLNFKCLALCTSLLTATSLSAPALSETKITKSISYFTIEGKTADELDAALAKHGPEVSRSGMRHPGITKIAFGGDVTFVTSERSCAIDRVNATLSTNIELPRWKNRRRAGPELGLTWDALSSDIKRHEERHAEIARQYARKLDQALNALRAEKSCDRLKMRISEVTQRIMDEHDADQERFDRVESMNFERRLERLILRRQQLAAE